MKIEFRNKGLDAIYISKIPNDKGVKAAIPFNFKHQNPPLISYRFMPPASTEIFIHRDVLRHLNTKEVIGDLLPVCTSTSSKY